MGHPKSAERGALLDDELPSSIALGPKIRSPWQHLSLAIDEVATSAVSRAGEQFWCVLSGNVTLTLEGKTYEFREGDSAHYDSTDAHHWHNTGERDALLMWVGTPSLL